MRPAPPGRINRNDIRLALRRGPSTAVEIAIALNAPRGMVQNVLQSILGSDPLCRGWLKRKHVPEHWMWVYWDAERHVAEPKRPNAEPFTFACG